MSPLSSELTVSVTQADILFFSGSAVWDLLAAAGMLTSSFCDF